MRHIPRLLALLLVGVIVQGQSATATVSQQPVAPTAGPYSWEWGPFTYDPSGNVAIIGNNYYVYDPMGRLVSWSMRRPDQSGAQTQTYGYDAYGNRTTVDGVTTYAVNTATNKLTGVGAVYDSVGNLVQWQPPGSAQVRTYTYDSLNMITKEVVGGHETVNVYTASDERLWRFDVTATVSHWTVRDLNGKVLRDFVDDPADGPSWKLHREYIYRGGQLLAANTPNGTEHYSLDHLGSVRLVTDGSKNKKFHHHYLPFGGEWTIPSDPTDASTLRFTGHERDNDPNGQPAAALDYMHARYYNPTSARFLSVDPGKDWDPKQPQSWNMYSYVRNNPINATDPNGKEIRYTDAYRSLVRNNPVYAKAHRLWYNSPQGRAQHRTMGLDTNTVYTIGVGKVTLHPFTNEQRAGGTWPPAGAAKTDAANKLDSPEVTVKVNIEYLSDPKLQVKTAAETIFHEVTHALDVGSGSVTRDQAIQSEEKLEEQDGTPDPRLEEYRRTLDETIPPR